MHWHGIRQMNSGNMDGTNGVTECPIPPGGSRTYTFLLTQFGSSWYHSHHSAQYGDGVLGPIVIAGPATSNYDIDLGAMPITDWYYQTAFQKSVLAAIPGPPPVADNGLINGTMLNPSGSGGAYNKVTLTSGKKYRLRLINTSVDNHFRVSLDNHNLTVIQADFVPTQPYVAEWIFLGIGERYDVIIDANQAVDNYWFRAEVMTACGANNNNGNIMSIFSYTGAADTNPTSTGTTAPQNCNDESGLIPYVVKNVDSTNFLTEYEELDVLLDIGTASNGQSVAQWNVNGSVIDVDWEDPTLKYVEDGNTTFATDLNLIQLPEANKVCSHSHRIPIFGHKVNT
jgi:FtsP/CotA-like multicopper oxidase with cupredoxin domain